MNAAVTLAAGGSRPGKPATFIPPAARVKEEALTSVTRMNVRETLETFLEEGKDWERKATSLHGVSILRMPRTTTRPPTLAMEINPVDDRGSPMKRKGIMIRSPRELESLKTVLTDPKVGNLMDALATVVPPVPAAAGKENAGRIEI